MSARILGCGFMLATLLAVTSFAGQPMRIDPLGAAGAPVLFIPGLNSHADVWRPWAEELASAEPGHRVFLVTPAGFAGVTPYKLADGFHAGLLPGLSALLEAEDLSDVTVIGHSAGGLVALMLARQELERVGRVLVVDSLPFLAGLFMPGTTPQQAVDQAAAMAQQMAESTESAYREQQAMTLPTYTKTASFLPTLQAWSAESDRATSIAAFKDTLGTDFRPALPEITQPVLVLAAWDAAMGVPKDHIETLYTTQYDGLPNVSVRIVENSFHFLMIDQPAAFEAALAEVLGR